MTNVLNQFKHLIFFQDFPLAKVGWVSIISKPGHEPFLQKMFCFTGFLNIDFDIGRVLVIFHTFDVSRLENHWATPQFAYLRSKALTGIKWMQRRNPGKLSHLSNLAVEYFSKKLAYTKGYI